VYLSLIASAVPGRLCFLSSTTYAYLFMSFGCDFAYLFINHPSWAILSFLFYRTLEDKSPHFGGSRSRTIFRSHVVHAYVA